MASVTRRMDIDFREVSYRVGRGKDTKQIVKGVSGKFKSGELTAIMGPSGAGKTSLLNILTGFQEIGTEGTIECTNSTKTGAGAYKKHSCYIMQDDHLAPLFTVMEIMTIACNLKIGKLSEKSRMFLIDDILNKLGLINCKKTRCHHLSGGQRKRLSVALELVDNPQIMFLDEPTTGLDIVSSTTCVEMLKKLAGEGRTIVCTIHQPSAALFEAFDHVYVMAEGSCIYQGSSRNAVPFLSSVGLNCPRYHNPADYLLEVASGEYGNFNQVLTRAAMDDKWRIYPEMPIAEKCDYDIITDGVPTYNIEILTGRKKPPSEWIRFGILLKKQLLFSYRDWTISQLKLIMHTLVGIFLGIVFMRCGYDASKVINNLGFFMCGVVYLCYTALMPAVLRFPSEINVLKKEHFNNWYKLRTYYAAFLAADIPMQIFFCIAYTATSYFISSQPNECFRFFMVLLMMCLVALASSSMGLIFGTIVNPINGTFFGAVTTCLLFTVGGFLIFFNDMSTVTYLVSYLSYLSFAMEGLMQAIYGYNRATLECPEEKDFCLYTSPKEVLDFLGMQKQNFWVDIGYVGGYIVILRIIAYFTLRRKLQS